jgi:hypothetical protein
MKIALITVHKVTNYGAIFQAFATISVLSKYGTVHTVDYQNPYLDSHLDVLRFKPSIRGIKMLAHDLLNLKNRSVLVKKFKGFIAANLNLTSKFTAGQLKNGLEEQYDVYVSGSDQIWNPIIINPHGKIDPNYFLAFAAKGAKKISCASSMGNYEFSEQQSSIIRDLLSDFHRISVREKEGRTYLQNLLPDKSISRIMDPSLMLSGSEWLSTFGLEKRSKEEGYILVYSVPRMGLLRRAITYYSEKFSLRVLAIDKMLIAMDSVDQNIRTAGPEEFVELFANARFVITDSFHGTCFSVNFEKPFVCIPAAPKSKANRQEGLLSDLGLLNRIVYDESEFSGITFDLDYSQAREKLRMLREDSLAFLEEAITS